MIRGIMSLALIGFVCSSLLAVTHHWTAPYIDSNRRAETRAIAELMLDATKGEVLDETIDKTITGLCGRWILQSTEAQGYAGPVEFLSLSRWVGETLTVSSRVTRHRETPGIGDFIDHRIDGWLPDRDDITLTGLAGLDRVTGATITYRAYIEASQRAFERTSRYCER